MRPGVGPPLEVALALPGPAPRGKQGPVRKGVLLRGPNRPQC